MKAIKFTAWIMFENHTFEKVNAVSIEEMKQLLNDAYITNYVFSDGSSCTGDRCIAGWGRLTFADVSCDDFCAFPGLYKRDEIKNINEEAIRAALEIKAKELEVQKNNQIDYLNKIESLNKNLQNKQV